MGDVAQDYAEAEAAWGDHEPEPRSWSAGAWEIELRGDELADIRFDGTIVLRSVRTVARVPDWITVPTTIESVEYEPGGIVIRLSQRGHGADVGSTLTVSADGDELTIGLEAIVRRGFDRNRLGLIVLHPPAVAGSPLEIAAPDETVRRTAFPQAISPHQPATDIASLTWTADGVHSVLGFTGDVFEMEDHRNWTDASFKTYSTPLSIPFPVHLDAGTVLRQTLTLSSERVATAASSASTDPASIRLVRTGHPMPQLIAAASTAPDPSSPPDPADAAAVLLVELDTRAANWRAALDRAAARGVPLDVRIVVRTPDDLPAVLDALPPLQVVRIGVFGARGHVTEPDAWERLISELAQRDLAPELVGGTRAHFTELNRTHARLPADLPALTFSMTPQMHATERAQLVESIPMQGLVAMQAREFAGERPLHIGPVTLRTRFIDTATSDPAPEPDDVRLGYGPERIPQATDPRQDAHALAAWTVASVAALLASGPATICYFEESGPRGAVDQNGRPYPVAEALRMLRAFEGMPALSAETGIPGVHVFGVDTERGVGVIAANLTARRVTLPIDGRQALVVPPFGIVTDFPPAT